jgi:hypothetical protein
MTPEEPSTRLAALAPDQLDGARAALYASITGGPRAADRGRSPIVDEAGCLLGPFTALIYRAARELILDGDLSDGRFAEVEARFGTTGCVELVVLIGYYRMLALVLRSFRVSLPSAG